jgi:hypothetical protein
MTYRNLGKNNFLELMLLAVFGTATIFIFVIHSIASDPERNNWFAAAIFSLGIFINNVIIIFKNQTKNQNMEQGMFSDFHNDLFNIGVIQIYPKRKDSEEKGYLHDLFDDFRDVHRLSRWHGGKNDPIKILGLALGRHLLRTEIGNEIEEYCKNINFHLLFCKEENKELESRLRFVNGKFEKLTTNDEWKCVSFNDTPLFDELTETKNKIYSLKEHIHSRIEAKQYSFSPFATIVIINDHIYYTPNVIEYLNYVRPGRLPPECFEYIYEAELSLCINRKSEFGIRLEKLFESLWENEENTNL